MDDHTFIASGYWDGGVSVFDADTGAETDGYPCPDTDSGWVDGIRIVQADEHAILVACWLGHSVSVSLRAWDAITRETLWSVEHEGGIPALEALKVDGRAVLVYAKDLDSNASDEADGMVVRDLFTSERISGIRLESQGYHLGVAEIDERKIVALSGVGIFELDDSLVLAKILDSEEPWLVEGGPLAFDESADLPTLAIGVSNRVEFVDPLMGTTMGEPLVVGDDNTWIDDLWVGGIGGRRVVFVGTQVEGFFREAEASLWDIGARRKLDASGRWEAEEVTIAAHDNEAGGIAAVGSSDGLQVWEPRRIIQNT